MVQWPELWTLGGDLVDQQPAVPSDEQLHAEHPHMIERPGDALGAHTCGLREGRRYAGGCQRHVEDAVRMAVFDRVEARDLPVRRASHDH